MCSVKSVLRLVERSRGLQGLIKQSGKVLLLSFFASFPFFVCGNYDSSLRTIAANEVCLTRKSLTSVPKYTVLNNKYFRILTN